jgi:flagellar basal-body rod protein FlgB
MDTYGLLKTALNVSQTRSELISNNIANVNTPNYKAQRVVFESQLSQAMNGMSLTETHKNHMQPGGSDVAYVTSRNTGFSKNGNNVDIDTEMVNQAQNSLYYSALTSQLNGRYSMMNYVVTH